MSRRSRKRGGNRRRQDSKKSASPGRVLLSKVEDSRIGASNPKEEPLKKTMNPETFRCQGEITKVDDGLGLVFGWLMVCQKRNNDGILKDYNDVHGNIIDPEGMVEALADYMINSRTTKAMHRGGPRGQAVFAFPMTEEIAKAYGFENVPMTGALFAAKPDPESLQKFQDGEYTGFSIGGVHLERPEPI